MLLQMNSTSSLAISFPDRCTSTPKITSRLGNSASISLVCHRLIPDKPMKQEVTATMGNAMAVIRATPNQTEMKTLP
jgi:hypothetical protein